MSEDFGEGNLQVRINAEMAARNERELLEEGHQQINLTMLMLVKDVGSWADRIRLDV